MSRLTRDGKAEPVSRDQILRHARGQGNIIFPVQLTTSRIGNHTRLIHTLLYVMTIHTYIPSHPISLHSVLSHPYPVSLHPALSRSDARPERYPWARRRTCARPMPTAVFPSSPCALRTTTQKPAGRLGPVLPGARGQGRWRG